VTRDAAVYTVVHQPRRLKLPAQPIPPGASPEDIARCLFDERLNERYFRHAAEHCYYPTTHTFLEMLDQGFKLSIGFSRSFLRQVQAWDGELMDLLKRLVAHRNVELIGVSPYHSFLLLIDLHRFVQEQQQACDELEGLFGKRPTVTDTTEMCMSDAIYHALDKAGFRAAMMDGREWVMGWRQPTHLYHGGKKMKLLTRSYRLSDDVGYRFDSRDWSGWPLTADTYSDWLRQASGEFVFLAWDYETFGEHHPPRTGIYEFLRALPQETRRLGVQLLLPGEIVEKYGEASWHLPLPAFPSSWAGEGGMELFLGTSAQQALFQLMLQAYNASVLTGRQELIEMALWLLQSDNLHMIQWFGSGGPQSQISAHFTPKEWWDLGPAAIIVEQQQVYRNFIEALHPYL
jgi:alpha-amylase